MTTATTSAIASIITVPAERTLGYAEALVKDIPADRFASMAIPGCNSPAFNLGHLALYPDRLLGFFGRPELARPRTGWAELFAAGCPCVDEPGRYPAKSDLVSHFMDRYQAILQVVKASSDEVFMRENPMEGRMKELFPTIGLAANFMLNNHVMMHLGQISAWRRAIGLPSAM